MELETTVIGLASVALFILPILYIQRKHKNERAKMLQHFLDLAAQQQLTISDYDFWDPAYAIGIDADSKKLFYTQGQERNEKGIVIDLAEVRQCNVVTQSSDAASGKVIDRVELVFTQRNSKHADKVLEFYNKEVRLNLGEELRLSQKWKDIVASQLQVQPVKDTGFAVKM